MSKYTKYRLYWETRPEAYDYAEGDNYKHEELHDTYVEAKLAGLALVLKGPTERIEGIRIVRIDYEETILEGLGMDSLGELKEPQTCDT